MVSTRPIRNRSDWASIQAGTVVNAAVNPITAAAAGGATASAGKDLLRNAATPRIEAAEGKPATGSIVAYNGDLMRVHGYGAVVVDLAQLEITAQTVLLADHDASLRGIVGYGQAKITGGQLTVAGRLSESTEAGRQIIALARDGFEFEASVGVVPTELARVAGGENVEINGRTITAPAGGLAIACAGRLREVSILPLGADGTTSVDISATEGKDPMPAPVLNEQEIRAQERERITNIEQACKPGRAGWGSAQQHVDALKAQAFYGTISGNAASFAARNHPRGAAGVCPGFRRRVHSRQPNVCASRVCRMAQRTNRRAETRDRQGQQNVFLFFLPDRCSRHTPTQGPLQTERPGLSFAKKTRRSNRRMRRMIPFAAI